MRLLLLALVFLLSFGTGCGNAPPPVAEEAPGVIEQQAPRTLARWTISSAFAVEEVDAITAAAQAWHDATSGRVNFALEIGETEPDAPWTVSRATSDGDASHEAETNAERNAVTLDPDRVPARCVWLMAAHEFGHILGLEHGGSVMGERHSSACTATITADDVALFDAANP